VTSASFFEKIFRRMDTTGGGVVSADQVHEVLHQIGMCVSRYEAGCMVEGSLKRSLESAACVMTMEEFEAMLRKSRFAAKLLGGAAPAPSEPHHTLTLDLWSAGIGKCVVVCCSVL